VVIRKVREDTGVLLWEVNETALSLWSGALQEHVPVPDQEKEGA